MSQTISIIRKFISAAIVVMVSIGILTLRPVQSAAPDSAITEFPTTGQPQHITVGPDGNLWFTEINAVGRITPSGVVTEFPLPSGSSDPHAITAGPDGNVWFTLPYQNKVGRISPTGVITETANITGAMGVTSGPDGNLWVTQDIDQIAQITTTGIITAFPIALASAPEAITLGPDSNLWYVITIVHKAGNKIGRISPTGVYTEFNALTWSSGIDNLVAGQDGNIWFAETWADNIGRITPAGSVTEFSLSSTAFTIYPLGITNGPDGCIWFTSYYTGLIGRITSSGSISYFGTSANSGLNDIVTGPDGNLWFTEYLGHKIGRLQVHRSFLSLVAR